MTDPLDVLRAPVDPVDPDPAFAASLRARLQHAVLDPRGATMSATNDTTEATRTEATRTEPPTTTDPAELAWGPALTPYIAVSDGRRALDWYVQVFDAQRRGEPYVMPDGSIGHAELGIGDAVLMLAAGYPEEGVVAPTAGGAVNQSIFATVPDADTTVRRAVDLGAELVRPVADESYGRTGVIRDPFGHRWMVNTLPARATRSRPGDVAYVTLAVPDAERAKDFYGSVLGWSFAPGSVEQGWQVEGTTPMAGLWGAQEQPAVLLCYRVRSVDDAVARVRAGGGRAEEPASRPYGRMADCVDDQGLRFQLWEPLAGE
jgi:uncharacterized glyoxalase superfamily protein PhnB